MSIRPIRTYDRSKELEGYIVAYSKVLKEYTELKRDSAKKIKALDDEITQLLCEIDTLKSLLKKANIDYGKSSR